MPAKRLRTYRAEDGKDAEFKDAILQHGTQWIGWDPAAKQIRSWSFEADGGYGESVWTKQGADGARFETGPTAASTYLAEPCEWIPTFC
jgi:hypothetical protein